MNQTPVLHRNRLLDSLSEKIAHAQPRWQRILSRFIDQSYKTARDEANTVSQLSEIHVRLTLEEASRSLEGSVQFDPITPNTVTAKFHFRQGYGRRGVVVRNRHTGEDHSDLDEVLVVDGLPVLWEIKLSAWRRGGKNKNPSTHGISWAMREERLPTITAPLREYFRTQKVGYVVVLPSGEEQRDSIILQRFADLGGIITPLYTTRENFKREAMKMLNAYSLI